MSTTIGSAIEHQVGSTGTVSIRTTDGDVTVTAVDGEVARLRSSDGRDLGDHYRWRLDDGALTLEPRDRGVFGFQRLFGDRMPDIVAEVPRDAVVDLETVSGAMTVHGARGRQRYRLVSGAIEATGVAGPIAVDEVSGAVHLDAVDRASIRVRTVSGSVHIAGPGFDSLDVHTMSGLVDVRGRLDGTGPFGFDGVSGSVSLAVDGPILVAGTTVSGSVVTDLPHRTSGAPGRRTIEVGQGGPLVAFKTVSGTLRVVHDGSAVGSAGREPDAATATGATDGTVLADDPRETARLEILRDLEAGRIDVSSATARLAELDGGSAAGPAAASTGPAAPSTGPTASGGGSSTTPAHDSWAVHFWDHRA
ncbi:MAG TPA: DUF4097 family beta strand repeat-containing protein [Candidatus Binatia bacterium]|nr:DUF4097 family beta strand repeat-containing protein [Candidatus Binatia bacterium]